MLHTKKNKRKGASLFWQCVELRSRICATKKKRKREREKDTGLSQKSQIKLGNRYLGKTELMGRHIGERRVAFHCAAFIKVFV